MQRVQIVSSVFLILVILFSFQGCTLIHMTQEGAEKLKTTSTHGYQNGIKPDEIRNIKDYIVHENDFVIIAEDPYTTVYKTRNESNMGRISILDDLMEYCEDINGQVSFGKQFIGAVHREYDSIDLEFSTVKNNYKKYKKKGYKGWMKCEGSNDDFEVLRKRSTKYFTITHEKEQLQGYALWWYIDYYDLQDSDIAGLNVGIWSYEALVQFSGICAYHKGTAYLNNRYSKNKKMNLNAYIIQQLDPRSKVDPYLMASGTFECENTDNKQTNFTLELEYSSKYRKILYTRRQ